jgi:alpha-mannosidase
MGFEEDLDGSLRAADAGAGASQELARRFAAEAKFAAELAEATPAKKANWQKLILAGAGTFAGATGRGVSARKALKQAEDVLAPLGRAAKRYTIHCVGHAHIDMNWMWNWPETVATTNDTFTTVDRLMDEFPTFKFSQSQASVYRIMKDYLPELYERVKRRIAEGRWEVTASTWVEGDKNLASGEIMCRHLLATRRFLKEEFGLDYDAVTIDWECDTFGHAATVPTILASGAVRRYYLHRASHGPMLFWWQGKDGSRVLVFDDDDRGYNGRINENITAGLFQFERETGLRDYLFVYGVGDHGGGPTRRDLTNALAMDAWPVFPNIRLSTTDAFYSIAEKKAKDLPVVDHELNYVFEGCYTAQSGIKQANRRSENALVEAELVALLARGLVAMPYPAESLREAWRHAMFNQFHDILPGSGVRATVEFARGLFQEIIARTSMVKTRALRAIAACVDTQASCRCGEVPRGGPGAAVGVGIGAGAGEGSEEGTVSRCGAGGVSCDPFVVFNPSPHPRTEVVVAKLWNRSWPSGEIAVTDDAGSILAAQVVRRGHRWGHEFIEAAFPAKDVPGLGYRSYGIAHAAKPPEGSLTVSDAGGTIENEFFQVEVESASGAVVHLIDKRTGIDFVPAGSRLGLLEYLLEAPHAASSWNLGQVMKTVPLLEGGRMDVTESGPWRSSIRTRRKWNDSTLAVTVSLASGVPRVEFELEVNWLERGGPEIGVPVLKLAFPLALTQPVATYECPDGFVSRSTDPAEVCSWTIRTSGAYFSPDEPFDPNPAEVPAQKWADLTGSHDATKEPVGAVLLNDSKYGHGARGNVLRLTLIRSSYEPDPLPELGRHVIRCALRPHVGKWTVSDSARAGAAFNMPLSVVGTTLQKGTLPASRGFAQLLTPNVLLSGMKKAEDSDALVVRLYEMEGRATTARMRLDATLAPSDAPAVQTDLLERPLAESTARMHSGVLSVKLPAFGIVTVKVG